MGDLTPPSPLPRDSFVLRGSDAQAFLDLGEEGRDIFVNQHVDERSACAWVEITTEVTSTPPEAEVSYIYAPES